MPDDGGKINDDIGLAEEKEAAEAAPVGGIRLAQAAHRVKYFLSPFRVAALKNISRGV